MPWAVPSEVGLLVAEEPESGQRNCLRMGSWQRIFLGSLGRTMSGPWGRAREGKTRKATQKRKVKVTMTTDCHLLSGNPDL